MKRIKKYNIPGNPYTLVKMNWKKSYNNTCSLQQSNIYLHLENQHQEAPKHKGKLDLDITFYVQTPHNFGKNKISHEGKPCTHSLLLWEFLVLLEKAAASLLFEDLANIYSITAKKVYSLDPRTEFTIRELE